MIFTDFIFYVLVKFVQLSLVFIKGNLTWLELKSMIKTLNL